MQFHPYRPRIVDALHSRSAKAASEGAFAVLNCTQTIMHPADQVLGLACAFKNMLETCGLSAAEVFALIDRMEADCRFRQVNTLAAVRRYCEGEIKAKFP